MFHLQITKSTSLAIGLQIFWFSFSFLFAAVIDLLLALLPVQKVLRKHHQDGQFLPWGSHVLLQEILLRVFHSKFLSIFLHISGSIEVISLIWVSLERSFPPAESEHRWCQVWSNVMTSEGERRPRSSRPVSGGMGVNGLINIRKRFKRAKWFCFLIYVHTCQKRLESFSSRTFTTWHRLFHFQTFLFLCLSRCLSLSIGNTTLGLSNRSTVF